MARIVFGADYLEDHAVILSLINANSPLVWDAIDARLGRASTRWPTRRRSSRRSSWPAPCPRSPRPASAPRPSPRHWRAWPSCSWCGRARRSCSGSFASSISMQSGRADVRDPGARARPVRDGGARAAPGRPVPLRRLAVRVQGPRRAGGLRVRGDPPADRARRRQLRAPRGGLARGRPDDGLREVRPRRRPVRDDGRLRRRHGPLRERPGARRDPRERPGPALPRHRPHAGQLRDRVLPLRRRRQQQLRAVARGRLEGRGRARQRDSGRRCSPSTSSRRWTPASTRPSRRSSRAGRRRFPDSDV